MYIDDGKFFLFIQILEHRNVWAWHLMSELERTTGMTDWHKHREQVPTVCLHELSDADGRNDLPKIDLLHDVKT